MREALGGRLLIAGPALFDPNFRRTVVLIGHHDEDGALGLILNRELEVTVDDVVPELAPLVDPGDRIFAGGPVQPDAAIVLADFEDPSSVTMLAFGSVGFMPPDRDPSGLPIRRARVFAGYAGWSAGQLEAEMQGDSWLTVPAVPEDVFSSVPERLWEQVVARMGGEALFLRSMPEDPSLN